MALTKKAVAEMTLRQGEDIPVPQHLVVGFDSLWVHDGSHILGSVLQGHSVPSYLQRKKKEVDSDDVQEQGELLFIRL